MLKKVLSVVLVSILLCTTACSKEISSSTEQPPVSSTEHAATNPESESPYLLVSYDYEEAVALADVVICAKFEGQEKPSSDGSCNLFFTPVEVLCGEMKAESFCVTLSSAQLQNREHLLLDFSPEPFTEGNEYLITLASTEDGYRSTLENGCLDTVEKHGLRWVGPIAVGSVSIHLYDNLSVYTAELKEKFPTHADYLRHQEQVKENRSPYPALCETDLVVCVNRPRTGDIDHPRKDPDPEGYDTDDKERKYEVEAAIYEVLYGETAQTDIKIVKSWGGEPSLFNDEILFLKKVGDFYYLSSFHLRSTRNADQKDLVVEYIRSASKDGDAE